MESKKSSKKSPIGLIILLVLSLGFLVALILFLFRKKKTITNLPQPEKAVPLKNQYDLKAFYETSLLLSGDKDVAIMTTAIAAHESGEFTSVVFNRNNNAFGMRQPERRESVSIGDIDKDGYANYKSVSDSIKDFYLWFDDWQFNLRTHDLKQTIEFMKSKGYFTASFIKYNAAAQKWSTKIQTEIVS